jgi:3-oxoadipate enol-lactonase
MLFGSTPGLKHSQAATWLPQVAKEGLRNFLARTISDRFPVDRTDPRHIEWFLDEAAKNDTSFIARFGAIEACHLTPPRSCLPRAGSRRDFPL